MTMEKIALIGLGYVGLPLAVEFGKKYKTVGFDINTSRVEDLKQGLDRTLEVDSEELTLAKQLSYTHNPEEIADCNIYIVAVPTPIDGHKRPDLTPLEKSSETVGKLLKKSDVVRYQEV